MNTRVIYAVGIIIIIIGVVFYLSNFGFLSQNESSDTSISNLNSSQDNTAPSNSAPPESSESSQLTPAQLNSQNLTLSVDSVEVVSVNDEPQLQVAFDVYNPNRGAAILETVTYNIYRDNIRLSSGDVGARTEGFVDSLASVYTIIGNQTIVLRDREPLTEEATSLFDSQGELMTLLANSSNSQSYEVNGSYFYTLNRGSDAQAREHSFSLQYPLN